MGYIPLAVSMEFITMHHKRSSVTFTSGVQVYTLNHRTADGQTELLEMPRQKLLRNTPMTICNDKQVTTLVNFSKLTAIGCHFLTACIYKL